MKIIISEECQDNFGINMRIKNDLLSMRDKKYKDFSSKLTPTVDPDSMIGIRIPVLRQYAKQLARENTAKKFLSELPHEYFEENNLHAFLVEQIRDFEDCVKELDRFLPFVDNWATCDSMRPKCFAANTDKLLPKIYEWISSTHEYTVRFSIECLMLYYLDEKFEPRFNDLVASVKREEYYIRMMVSWYFATALAKQWDQTLPYISLQHLDPWVFGKTIQKACESYKITEDQKQHLRSLKNKIDQ